MTKIMKMEVRNYANIQRVFTGGAIFRSVFVEVHTTRYAKIAFHLVHIL